MLTVNMHDAKSKLSSLVERLELGEESEVVIARNGTPVARLVPFTAPRRIGAARHLLAGLDIPATVEAFNAGDEAIAADFDASAQQGLAP
ncbi:MULTISPECIES: type II toxin-antitoxin system Phd/YefM family antitoxin [Paraburkholderia]|uniref:Antitoxin n=1 Tax=Paraburkholderia hospita TaxID=169430 RepID=A0AAJ4VXU8_9BURK|nr:type II toxin-antitoxin system prevent-host-death family antitoxin [Paraburkholderia hospita]AUT69108.1 type II toxin-antitoxin system prevent-host-death family antitoxin [Paraburkholderia hospita]AXE99248.1 type II toxin-antitoxin system prevent-host-death family antitoxin [Paraburkholderia hospita]EIN02322.1 prevent-host-death protein [Paraburkholderia hospita]OUL85156.1 prevent-host-death family protein [Paraburkholderia hospita]OUL93334.1 prevent-host-death family protein [Paraburkholde